METLALLGNGFALVTMPKYLAFCLAGVLLGQVIGVLPGVGPAAGIAMLLPLTFGGDPIGSTIMFAGIYYGAYYGGTLTSVLVNIPGEAASVMTCIDGHEMARQGRAGPALGIAAVASFVAGTLGTVGLMLAAPTLARGALAFGPQEYFALVVLGLSMLAIVGGSLLKGLIMGVTGLCLATIGVDPQVGNTRFTLGQIWLLDGLEFLVLAVAFFGVGEVLAQAERGIPGVDEKIRIRNAFPTLSDLKTSRWPIARGTVIGFLIGVLPGTGATIASFVSYAVERKVSKTPERFGNGAIEGVAGPEAANNSASAGAMVPMFALGIPGSNTTAIMLGALIMFGLRPGPALFEQNPDFVWAVIASMYVGNVVLLILNLPLVGVFAFLLRVPYAVLYPIILAICIAGVYSQSNSISDLWILCGFGVVGYLMNKYDFPAAPLVLGLVLEPLLETSLRQSMTLSHGSLSFLTTRPIAFALILATAVVLVLPMARILLRTTKARLRRAEEA